LEHVVDKKRAHEAKADLNNLESYVRNNLSISAEITAIGQDEDAPRDEIVDDNLFKELLES
jgi:hypothetical protein